MGPLLGVILVDYWLIRRGRLDVAALYQEHGEYRFQGGWNVKAFVAAGLGALFSSILPHFTTLLPSWWGTYGWFFGVGIAGVAYYLLHLVVPMAVQRHA
jgi:NCS1 family nucleobase:cation symporter-1